jgi:hypothetical protein
VSIAYRRWLHYVWNFCAQIAVELDYQDKHCITDQTDKGTEDDRGRDGRTNFTCRIKEQAARLNPLFEHDDDDESTVGNFSS